MLFCCCEKSRPAPVVRAFFLAAAILLAQAADAKPRRFRNDDLKRTFGKQHARTVRTAKGTIHPYQKKWIKESISKDAENVYTDFYRKQNRKKKWRGF